MLQGIAATILLHVIVVGGASAQCTIGDAVEPTQSADVSGQFVNLNDPATCSGNLTAWHFCYYRSSIDNDSSIYQLYFKVWRNVQGNSYALVSTIKIQDSPVLNSENVICMYVPLPVDQYVPVERGDVIAVYTPFTLPTVSVLAMQPAVTQELYQDTRGISAFDATRFSRSDLRPENMYGLHLQADITPATMSTTATTTMATTESTTIETTMRKETTLPPTTETNPPPTTLPANPATSPSVSLPINATELQVDTTIPPKDTSSGIVAAVVIIVLLLVIGLVVGLTLLFACYIKRKHGTFKGFIQRSRNKFLAIDNLIYRVGSDRIPFDVTKTNQPAANVPSTPYDIPTDKHKRTLYDIPRNKTPSVHESQNYSVVRPVSQSTSAAGSTQQTTSGARGKNGRAATLEKSDRTYIFMDNSIVVQTETATELEQSQAACSENPDGEVYVYLRYGTVEYRKLLSQAKDEPEGESPFQVPPSDEEEIYVVLSEQHIKVIPRKAIDVKEQLGCGHFGKVDKGVWSGSKGTLQVAIKSLNKDASQADKVRLLQEAAIMGQFKHPNITHLHGIVTQGEEVLLILEYMPKGDLKHYLTKLRPKPNSLIPGNVPQLLVGFSQQIALGMHYLASKGFVHRDLAARNIFVSEDNVCKIGDFGMSRDLSEDGSYKGQGGKVPLKWTAPEALHRRKYTTASDVWSYGCLLFEIWSLGRKPFKGVDSKKALQLIDGGYRLPPPTGCPFVVYDLMMKCWHPVAGARPKYRDILTSLLQEEKRVLDIPIEDASTHPEACLLGAPMEAGKDMYLGLQHCYNADASDQYDPDYEYGETD